MLLCLLSGIGDMAVSILEVIAQVERWETDALQMSLGSVNPEYWLGQYSAFELVVAKLQDYVESTTPDSVDSL
jgi:hypothetical protein